MLRAAYRYGDVIMLMHGDGHLCYASVSDTQLLFMQDVIWDENITLDDIFKYSLVTDILRGLKYIHSSSFKFHGSLRSSSCVVDGRCAHVTCVSAH